jgi:ADP-ribose pyrophosphatase
VNFEILSSTTTYTGRILAVERVEACMPNGKTGNYDLVRHNDSVSILPLDHDGNIWFVRQYRLGAEKELLELPAGVMELNEDPLECAHREIREETGMDAGSMVYLGKAYLAPGYCTEAMYFYLARDLQAAPLGQDEDEFIVIQKIPSVDIPSMIKKGLIQDSKTLAALTLASLYM